MILNSNLSVKQQLKNELTNIINNINNYNVFSLYSTLTTYNDYIILYINSHIYDLYINELCNLYTEYLYNYSVYDNILNCDNILNYIVVSLD